MRDFMLVETAVAQLRVRRRMRTSIIGLGLLVVSVVVGESMRATSNMVFEMVMS